MLNWLKNLFTKARPQPHIWKEVKCEYLREFMDYGHTPQSMTKLYVHAITMICVATGNVKITERYALHKLEEFDNFGKYSNEHNTNSLSTTTP